MENNLKAGDIVRLKSGGPVMTIQSLNTGIFDQVDCKWFVNDEVKKSVFNKHSLELVDELPKK
jgi:uncharacterized protein YodC (DUF2158 family)